MYVETHSVGEEKEATLEWPGLPSLWILRTELSDRERDWGLLRSDMLSLDKPWAGGGQ